LAANNALKLWPGSWINVSQMVACVGQQIISGSRVPDGFQDRSLPHFIKKAKNPPNKGFVSNSFYTGLSPSEFLFHACSGREGLVDTAVKTAETGYMQRRLMKALEDLSVRYDTSVRNSVGGIVQFAFGDDGLDPANLEGQISPINFARSWRHIRAIVPPIEGRGMFPFEIREYTQGAMKTPRFRDSCLPAFLDSIIEFVKDEVVKPAVDIRMAYGLLPAESRPKRLAELTVSEDLAQTTMRSFY
jgi:DNA-directed RNA polymerase III subunit RPC1